MADERASANNKIVGNLYVKLVTGTTYKIPFAEKDQVCVIETYNFSFFLVTDLGHQGYSHNLSLK